jgi:hypothetical protein
MTGTNLSGQRVNPVLLTNTLFRCLGEMLEAHARNMRAEGLNEDAVRWGVDRYRGQLLEQMLRLVITNGPEWFGGDDWVAALEAFPTSGLSH